MDKPILIVQLRPEDETADSEFRAMLKYGGLEESHVWRLRAEQTEIPVLNLEELSAIIVGGSPFDITTPDAEKSHVQHRVESDFRRLFDQIIPADFPFLGCCSGNGLLGSWLGAPLSRKYSEPISVVDVEITDEGKDDPLLSGFPDRFRVRLGHKEACDSVPPTATLLARGDVCPVQMFRVGKNVYATQFHPEADEEEFRVRIQTYQTHGYFPAGQADSLLERLAGERTPWSQKILSRFVERYMIGAAAG